MALRCGPLLGHWSMLLPCHADGTAEIAERWNVVESGAGYVTTFIDADYVARFEVRQVGGANHLELWIPAEELEASNQYIVGVIRVVRHYLANGG